MKEGNLRGRREREGRKEKRKGRKEEEQLIYDALSWLILDACCVIVYTWKDTLFSGMFPLAYL